MTQETELHDRLASKYGRRLGVVLQAWPDTGPIKKVVVWLLGDAKGKWIEKSEVVKHLGPDPSWDLIVAYPDPANNKWQFGEPVGAVSGFLRTGRSPKPATEDNLAHLQRVAAKPEENDWVGNLLGL